MAIKKLFLVTPRATGRTKSNGEPEIEHNPGCCYEEWDHETHSMRNCGRHSVARVGEQGQTYLCVDHAVFFASMESKVLYMVPVAGSGGKKWDEEYNFYPKFSGLLVNEARKWDKEYHPETPLF